MVWEIKAYSSWLFFLGFLFMAVMTSLFAFHFASEYAHLSLFEQFLRQIPFAGVIAYMLLRSFKAIKSRVICRLDDDGIYLAGRFFVPYKDILSFSKLNVWVRYGHVPLYTLIIDGEAVLPSKISLFLKGVWAVRSKHGLIYINLPLGHSMNYTYDEFFREMSLRYKKIVGHDLRADYFVK